MAASAQAVVDPRKLPKKEAELFNTLVACYERKEYKKGIKSADAILKKFPNHGETQAMKGLVYNCMGKKEEAYELVKLGLKHDVRSHICWHVYGLLYRSDNNYKEASKCYLNALRIAKDSQNIMRDLSWLQLQMRDFTGFVATRRRILETRPSVRSSWVAAALANFVAGDFSNSYEIISKSFDAGITDKFPAYDESELLLFQNKCLEKEHKFAEALEHLTSIEPRVVDVLSLKVKRAELLVCAGRFEEARLSWLALLDDQPDNYRFHSGLQTAHLELEPSLATEMFALRRLDLPSTCLELSEAQRSILLLLYRGEGAAAAKGDAEAVVGKRLFSSGTIKKIELALLQGEELRAALDTHMRKALRDGLPALYHDVCSLVKQPNVHQAGKMIFVKESEDFKVHPIAQLALELVEKYVHNLRTNGTFDDAPAQGAETEVPTALLWAMFLLCHLKERCADNREALLLIEECIAHTPTAPDMHLKKARLLKKAGCAQGATAACDEGRLLDLQDRYLNNKATKYLLRADKVNDALDTIALFARNEGDPKKYLAEMQCSWFECEYAESCSRLRQWGPALKMFDAVQKHFNDYNEDMFDFHGFCIRKTTLRTHTETLAMLDNAYAHKFYQRACRGAVRILLHLIDEPGDIEGLGHLSPADRKKEKAKRKKQKQKEEKQREVREKAAAEEAKWLGIKSPQEGAKEVDPLGEKFLADPKKFIDDAATWCGRFANRLHLCDGETLALVADVAFRRGKFVTAAKALKIGFEKGGGGGTGASPSLFVMLVKVAKRLGLGKEPKTGMGKGEIRLTGVVSTVVGETITALLGGKTLLTFVQDLVARVEAGGVTITGDLWLAAARCCVVVYDAATGAAAVARLLGSESIWQGRGVTCSFVEEVQRALMYEFAGGAGSAGGGGGGGGAIEQLSAAWKEKALAHFPLLSIGVFAAQVEEKDEDEAKEEGGGEKAAAAAAAGGESNEDEPGEGDTDRG